MPTVGIGVPLYNGERYLRDALDSLVAQTYDDFVLTLVDDGSTDRTAEIAAEYAARDQRVIFARNPARFGLIGNWRRAFELTAQRSPHVRYFAWGSDHDLWSANWLRRLVEALESREQAVLAYPIRASMDDAGADLRKRPPRFHTMNVRDPRDRLRSTVLGMSAGNMVYGLFRADALRTAGVLPAVLLPDRLLLARLALLGEFVQVDDALWRRRYRKNEQPSLARQRRNLYSGRPPLAAFVPWWLVHPLEMNRWLKDVEVETPCARRRLSAEFLVWSWREKHNRSVRRRRRWRRRTKRSLRDMLARRLRRGGRGA